MEGGGRKSIMKMIAVVILLIVGMSSGQMLASSRDQTDACFNKCFDGCTASNPNGDFEFFAKCNEDCHTSCTRSSPLDGVVWSQEPWLK